MSADSKVVQQAREEADLARHRMIRTFHELMRRVAPGTLARGAWEGAKSRGADLAEDAVDAVRKRPVAATGAVAALAMFLAREPLMDFASKLWNGTSKNKAGKGEPDDRQEPKTRSHKRMETVE